MSVAPVLSARHLEQLRAVAVTLIPGLDLSPPAVELPDFDQLLEQAGGALGAELGALRGALALLPGELDWAALSRFAQAEPAAFELVSTVTAGAYFMSTAVLESIGYPTGPRRRAPQDLVTDELGGGLLEPVLARGSLVRIPPKTSALEN